MVVEVKSGRESRIYREREKRTTDGNGRRLMGRKETLTVTTVMDPVSTSPLNLSQ